MSAASNSPDDGFDFIRKMWSNMGFALPGVMTPTLDAEEIERRITDLKAVEGWLKMNLGVLQMTIQGMEVQRATLAAMKAMSPQQSNTEEGPAAANPFTNPALWSWPFASAAQSEQAPAGGNDTASTTETSAETPRKPSRKTSPKT